MFGKRFFFLRGITRYRKRVLRAFQKMNGDRVGALTHRKYRLSLDKKIDRFVIAVFYHIAADAPGKYKIGINDAIAFLQENRALGKFFHKGTAYKNARKFVGHREITGQIRNQFFVDTDVIHKTYIVSEART